MKYIVSVTETYNRLVCVEANDKADAIEKTYAAWDANEIVLDKSDFTDDVEATIYDDDQEHIDEYNCKNHIK